MPEIKRVQYEINQAPKPENRGLAEWELALAKCVALDFIEERGPLQGSEANDLVQEILIHWIKQKQRYDVNAGASVQTFFRKVAKNKLEDIYREERAEKRGGGNHPLSLDCPVNDEDNDDEAEVLGDFVENPIDEAAQVENKDQYCNILRLLSPRQQKLAEGLEQGYRLTEMARKMDIPRTTLNDELNRIKRTLRKHGYGKNHGK